MNFDDNDKEMRHKPASAACADWGALLPDAAEDLLGEAERAALDLHLAGCAVCAEELAEATRGAAWLSLLKGYTPEPPQNMVAGILARTSGAASVGNLSLGNQPLGSQVLVETQMPSWLPPVPSLAAAWLPQAQAEPAAGPVRHWIARVLGLNSHLSPVLQPRLTMTAAMAFCSVCLTFNLLGVSVTRLNAQDLQPAGLQRTVAGKGATLLRSFEGIRIVYRVESRVSDWVTASNVQDGQQSQGQPRPSGDRQ